MLEGKKISELDLATDLQKACCFPILNNGVTRRVTYGTLLSKIENDLPDSGIDQVKEDVENLKVHVENNEKIVDDLNIEVDNLKSEFDVIDEMVQGQNATIRNCVSTVNDIENTIAQTHFEDVLELEELVRLNTTKVNTIEPLIPAQASAENQLADKAFVEESVEVAITVDQTFDAESENAQSGKAVNGALSDFLINTVYPVGSMYWTENKDFNPNTSFGGTWTRVKDKFIYAYGDGTENLGSQAGASSVTLSTANLPKHTHYMQNHTHSFSGDTGNMSEHSSGTFKGASATTSQVTGVFSQTSTTAGSYGGSSTPFYIVNANLQHNHSFSGTTGGSGTSANTGDGGFTNSAFNIMPPYERAYCWKRTA